MGKRAKEKKSSRRRPRNVAQTVDAGDEQPDTGRKSRNKNKTKHNHHNNTTCLESEEDAQLTKSLAEHGLEVLEMSSDGNCLFRALSDQLYGDCGNEHATIRSDVCDFMEQNKDDFQVFLVFEDKEDDDQQDEDARDFEHYIEQIREEGEWGGNLEIVAAARLYKRNVRVYSATLAAFTIDHGGSKSIGPDLLVSYHAENHYNSVRNKGAPPKRIDASCYTPTNDAEKTEPEATANDPPSRDRNNVDPSGMCVKRGESRDKGATLEKKVQSLTIVDKSVKKKDPCPCGSGCTYKKCCLLKHKQAARTEKMNSKLSEDEEDKGSSSAEQRDNTPSRFQMVKI